MYIIKVSINVVFLPNSAFKTPVKPELELEYGLRQTSLFYRTSGKKTLCFFRDPMIQLKGEFTRKNSHKNCVTAKMYKSEILNEDEANVCIIMNILQYHRVA